jgi:hypothetical protein
MRIEMDNAMLHLRRGQTLKLRDGAGATICAREGVVWITEEDGAADVVLERGRCHRLARPGLALVQAFADADIVIA